MSKPNTKTPRPRARWRPRDVTVDAGLLLTALIWGINFTAVKTVLGALDPLALNAVRFPLAALALLVTLRATGRRAFPPRTEWGQVAALGLIGVTFQILFIFGIDGTRTGNAALLLSTSPVAVIVISLVVGLERFRLAILGGALTTLAGTVILVLGGGQAVGDTGLGDLLMLGAAISWAAFTVFAQRLTARHGALEVTAWTLWAGLPVIVLAGIPDLLRTDWSSLTPGILLGCVYTGVFGIAIAYTLWSRSVPIIGRSRTAVYANLVPVIALVTAWLWLGEAPMEQQVVGAVAILAGVALTRGFPRPPDGDPPAAP